MATASDLSGYFFVGFEGHWSEKISYDASADDVVSALAGIPTVGQINVSMTYSLLGGVLVFQLFFTRLVQDCLF